MKKFLVLLFFSCLIGAEIPVDLADPVYRFISRMENRGILLPAAAAKPFTISEISEILQTIDSQKDKLSRAETNLLLEHLSDYRLELREEKYPAILSQDKGLLVPLFSKNGTQRVAQNVFSRSNQKEAAHLFTFEKNELFIWGDVGLRFENQWKNSETRFLMSDRYILQGGLSENLFFHVKFFRYSRQNNDNFTELTDEEIGNWSMEQPEGTISFDNVYSSMVYRKNNFSVGLYHQPLTWGKSDRNNLILSGYGAPFSYVGMDYRYKGIEFRFMHGSLLNDSTRVRSADFDIRNQEKYIAAHRIDIPLFHGTTRIGLSEMVIYGNRNIDPGYLLPVNFFWSIEHTLMDRDNSLMALDFQTNAWPGLLFYGTLFLDELRFGELFKDWWANKHGWQLGIRYSHQLFSLPMDWQTEFSALRPWTYSHKFFINNYTNNGVCLGLPFGGNSRLLEISNHSWLNRRTRLDFKYSYLKHGYDGENEYFGGDPTVSYEKRNEQYDHSTQWLMGDLQVTDYFSLRLNYEIYNDAYWSVEMKKYFSGSEDFFMNMGINLDF